MFTSLANLYPLICLLAVFALMLIGVRLRMGLGFSVLGGSLVLAFCFGMGPLDWALAGLDIFKDQATLLVWLVLSLILALSSLMESTQQVERFMLALSRHIHSARIRLVFFPLLIGLLPMPGGAVFSAPLIQAVARKLAVPELDKSLVNYWFRHTAEMTWPLFPAVILAASMGGISTPQLVLYTCPLALGFFGAGWLCLVRGLRFPPLAEEDRQAEFASPAERRASWREVLRQGSPIFLALGGALGLELALGLAFPSVPVDYAVPVALAVGLYCCLRQNGLGFADFVRAVVQRHVLSMIFVVGALGVFKIIIEQSGLIEGLLHLSSGNAALLLAAVAMPLLVGLVTGLLMACVGITMPLLLALVPAGETVLPWIALSLASGFVGAMFSPLHICFVLSCQYFKVDMGRAWKRLPMPCLLFGLYGALYFFLMH